LQQLYQTIGVPKFVKLHMIFWVKLKFNIA
jgi:hypothetical protein